MIDLICKYTLTALAVGLMSAMVLSLVYPIVGALVLTFL